MNTTLIIALAGACGGLGVWFLLQALVPERSDLLAALTRPRTFSLMAPADVPSEPPATERGIAAAQTWIERRLDALAWLTTPDDDLAVLEQSRGTFLLVKVGASIGAFLIGPIYTVIFTAFGLSLGLTIPVIFGLILAVVIWLTVGVTVHNRAERRRREMRYALVSFLTLVALHRAAGEAMEPALRHAAESSPAWTFRRIAQRMESASRSSDSNEWAGLAALAAELGIDELADLASIAETAGNTGAGVYSTLMARAQSLRRELQNNEQEAAAAASTQLAIPKVVLTFTTFVFLLYPALIRLAGS